MQSLKKCFIICKNQWFQTYFFYGRRVNKKSLNYFFSKKKLL